MRIVHVITRLIIGGAQENTLLSCEGQHDLGHDVTLLTGPALGPEGSLMARAAGYGYRVETVDEMRRSVLPVKDFRTYHRLVKRLRELRPDVVHTHSSKAGIIGRWAADRARVPVIVHTIHGLAFTASTSRVVNSVYRRLERTTAPLTTRIVCVADAMREQSLATGVGTPDQYVTVYSGMETRPFTDPPVPRGETRKRLGLADHHVAVGTIARLFHLKGHDDLLDLAPALCREFPQLRFLWVGDGLLREFFEHRITQMGLADRFILTGLVSPQKVPELTAAMDVLVHPSRREGLARALPQGSLACKPVVTYDVDGNREALVDGVTGFALPPFDRQKLVQALRVLLADPGLRRSMGEEGRAFALRRFDAKVMVDALERVYRDAGARAKVG
ncbi:MAG: putative glycosyl transferase (WbnE) [uncultured Phycisphaerae bacterium]|uniref:Putative glycosyl transferase (WbnE) n=1 Tax=uncultured Phycisphaerae bacterium TaxID=904963 RepID=A0A6J4N9C7_9BACT|nr:MAG: putative glycosyl transferase (WbnE) [uncultured Phycisphaerae bacterium]